MSVKANRILTLLFGATTGVTLHEFIVGSGFRQLWNREIPWEGGDGLYLWPMTWLEQLLAEVKGLATPGTIIFPAMWGADVVHLGDGGHIMGPAIHYRSIPSDFSAKKIAASGIPKHEFSRLMGCVHPEFYQPVFATAFWRERTRHRGAVRVVPLADWITFKLSGKPGHDPVMLHNQGLAAPTAKLVNCFFAGRQPTTFAPVWPVFGSNELIAMTTKGAYCVPCTHDSALARLVLAGTGEPWGLWTGSWYGVCCVVGSTGFQTTLSARAYNAGLVFEALPGGLTAISNIGMHGPLYKALRDVQWAQTYEAAAQLALAKLERVMCERPPLTFSDELLEKQPAEFAQAALTKAGRDLGLALAIMANTLASKSVNGVMAAAQALKCVQPSRVAVVGGFAENPAFLKALEQNGLTSVVPPFAGMATQAGMAVRALRLSGQARAIKEALQMLPNKVLPD